MVYLGVHLGSLDPETIVKTVAALKEEGPAEALLVARLCLGVQGAKIWDRLRQ